MVLCTDLMDASRDHIQQLVQPGLDPKKSCYNKQHPRRTPKDKRRRVGGFRTSFIPHPDSIAGKGNGDVYRTDDFWNCLNENERGVIQMFKTQAFHRLGHPWVCKKLPHQAKRTQKLRAMAIIRFLVLLSLHAENIVAPIAKVMNLCDMVVTQF